LVLHYPSNSANDIDIHNYNILFWLRNNNDEALRIWNPGKQIGFTTLGSDEEVISRSKELEG